MKKEQKSNQEVLKSREIPNSGEFNCFGCSPSNNYGLKLRLFLSDNGCFTECSISENYCGFEGMVHGGIIATLHDEVAAWTIISHLFRFGVTREITTKFLSPIRANELIRVEGEIITNTGKEVVIRSKIISENGLLLTEAESKWFIPSFSTLAKITGMNEQLLEKMIESIIQPVQNLRRTNR